MVVVMMTTMRMVLIKIMIFYDDADGGDVVD